MLRRSLCRFTKEIQERWREGAKNASPTVLSWEENIKKETTTPVRPSTPLEVLEGFGLDRDREGLVCHSGKTSAQDFLGFFSDQSPASAFQNKTNRNKKQLSLGNPSYHFFGKVCMAFHCMKVP